MLLLLGALQQGDSLPLRSFLLQAVKALLKHLDLVLQVAYLIALGFDLLRLKLELGGLLFFFGEGQLKCTDFFELSLNQLYCLCLRSIVTFLTQ